MARQGRARRGQARQGEFWQGKEKRLTWAGVCGTLFETPPAGQPAVGVFDIPEDTMIQHVRVDHHTHDAVIAAARAAGVSYNAMLEMIVADWARLRNQQHQHEQHPHDDLGVVPGGD